MIRRTSTVASVSVKRTLWDLPETSASSKKLSNHNRVKPRIVNSSNDRLPARPNRFCSRPAHSSAITLARLSWYSGSAMSFMLYSFSISVSRSATVSVETEMGTTSVGNSTCKAIDKRITASLFVFGSKAGKRPARGLQLYSMLLPAPAGIFAHLLWNPGQ